jgi:tRNA(fMet)-specific endonuclease VapC
MKILDTDHCVAVLRGRLDLSLHVETDETLAVTSITVAELFHGAHRSANASRNQAAVELLLSNFDVLDFDETSARIFGLVKAQLQTAHILIEDLDLQIASITLRHASTLVTHNRRHYERVQGLQIVDWL